MAMIGAEMVLPLYIQNIRGESAFHSGLMLLPGALVMGLMMPVTGRIFDKIGARRLAITGMFILTAATLPFAFLTKATPIIYIIVLYAIRMFGISMVMMPVTTSGMNALPMNLLSHGTAVNKFYQRRLTCIGLIKNSPTHLSRPSNKRNTKRLSRSLLRGNNLWRSRLGDYFLLK